MNRLHPQSVPDGRRVGVREHVGAQYLTVQHRLAVDHHAFERGQRRNRDGKAQAARWPDDAGEKCDVRTRAQEAARERRRGDSEIKRKRQTCKELIVGAEALYYAGNGLCPTSSRWCGARSACGCGSE